MTDGLFTDHMSGVLAAERGIDHVFIVRVMHILRITGNLSPEVPGGVT